MIEAKFWAGLTANQPVRYLDSLPNAAPGVLAFIAPAARLPTLWPELVRRCSEGRLEVSRATVSDGLTWARIGSRSSYLVLASWRYLLACLERAVVQAGEEALVADVRQLLGLCEKMDSEAFLPLRGEELSPSIGRRIQQFCQVVDLAADRLIEERTAAPNGRAGRAGGRYIRWLLIRGNSCSLYYSPEAWATLRETPLWMGITNGGAEVRARLHPLELESPPRLVAPDGFLRVPIDLPLGVELDAVVSSVVTQVHRVAELLPESTGAQVAPPADDEP